MFDIQENLKKLPDEPGVYLHKDKLGQIIYVGKAVSLKKRVRQYFQSSKNMDPKVRAMVANIEEFEYIRCGSEMEALVLENNLIKKYQPKYNILLRDDKTYPYICVTADKWPRIIKAGGVCDRLVCLSDLFATLADFLGWKIPDDAAEDSVSNRPLWEDPEATEVREYLVHQSIDGSLSIRHGRYKLEMCPGSGGWSYPAPGEETPDMPSYQLYDLKDDVGETRNVINEHPDIFTALRAELKREVLIGRSTPGKPQKNTGSDVWDTVRWLKEE